MAQGPNYGLQGGSQWIVDSSGTLTVNSGGSAVVASGGNLYIAAASGINLPSGVTLGGTVFRAAYGTVALASGVGTIATGLTRAYSAGGVPAARPGAGSTLFVAVDLSLGNAGSVILYAGSANGSVTGDSTVSWWAFGT